jgi:ribonuclease R
VPSGSALDREAYRRGNSCYFPDRVVPMLPEALSNGLCSLVPGQDRACLAVHLTIDKDGRLKSWKFVRGLMKSAARLTYEQVQAARDGQPDDATGPLMDTVVGPLYGAFEALLTNREMRGTLDFDLPEMQVELSDSGHVTAVTPRKRLDSHRVIEEFMICANVAAARVLDDKSMPLLYRVHDEPDKARLIDLRDFLKPLGYSLTVGQVAKPRMFQPILERAAGRPEGPTVMEMVLRAQNQALYQPDNVGHFGLALPAYAHFTSPIRRYADLIVHRALIRALGLGKDGLSDEQMSRLEEIGEHISDTERRAVSAERDAMDRYLAAYLADRVGERFGGRITGVTRFGLFVRLDETGADGLIPMSALPDDYYALDEQAQALVGRRWGRVYQLGASVRVKLVEADPISGSTLLALAEGQHDEGAATIGASGRNAGPSKSQRRGPPQKKARGKRTAAEGATKAKAKRKRKA